MWQQKNGKSHGTPRDRSTYRSWKRKNAIEWYGVETKREFKPPLVKKVSERGEVHYVEETKK